MKPSIFSRFDEGKAIMRNRKHMLLRAVTYEKLIRVNFTHVYGSMVNNILSGFAIYTRAKDVKMYSVGCLVFIKAPLLRQRGV